jgi:hypothetical protein
VTLVSQPSTRGREIAHLFRDSRGLLTTRACDIDAILSEAEVEVTPSRRSDPGYAAVLIRLQGGGAGIMMAADQPQGRRRFSLAHELGHFYIPAHLNAGPMLKCADADLRARSSDSKVLEWEANDFAAELLMPRKLFGQDIRNKAINFGVVEQLAGPEMYQISMTAAAWRLVQLTREPCALVMSVEGAISWVARSESFPYRVPERNQRIGSGTAAAAVFRGEAANRKAESVPPYEWLEIREGRSLENIELLESTFAIPSLRQILSLLWVSEIEENEFDD